MKRVLVLGGDEFIGGRVLLALADSGWARPIAEPRIAARFRHAHIEALAVDMADANSFAPALQGVDAVVNCLSGRPQLIARAAAALFPAAAQSLSPPLIVHISSMSVYGSTTGVIGEDAPLQENLAPYARAKVEAEKIARHYARKIILRPGCEYGPGGELWSARVAKWLCTHRLGDLGANGDGYCNLLHIDDLANAVMRCLQLPAAVGHTFNLGVEYPPTWNEYFFRYASALGAVPVKRLSSRNLLFETKLLAAPLKVLEIAAQRAGLPPIVPPPVPPSFLSLARQEIRLDCARARNLLGWQNRPIDQGIAETASWFMSRSG